MLRSKLSIRPAAVPFRKTILATDYDQFLLSVEPFDRTEHAEFADLVKYRLGMEIHYESLYGGEVYKTERKPHPETDDLRARLTSRDRVAPRTRARRTRPRTALTVTADH